LLVYSQCCANILASQEKLFEDALWENGDVTNRLISFEDLAPTLLGFAGVTRLRYTQGYYLSQHAPVERTYIYADRARMDSADLRSYFVMDNDMKSYISKRYVTAGKKVR